MSGIADANVINRRPLPFGFNDESMTGSGSKCDARLLHQDRKPVSTCCSALVLLFSSTSTNKLQVTYCTFSSVSSNLTHDTDSLAMEPSERPRPARKAFPRLLQNLRCFSLDAWPDFVSILAVGGMTAGVRRRESFGRQSTNDAAQIWAIPARPPLLFPLMAPDGTVYNPSISYPYLSPIFSSLAAGLFCSLVPLGSILLFQLRVCFFPDFAAALVGLLYSLVTGTCFQVVLKKAIGGLRPHFLAVCRPVIPEGVVGQGYNGIMYSVTQVCTGDKQDMDKALQSCPSGHSEIAFAGLGYLAIYLYTHLRIGDGRIRCKLAFWRMLAVLAPLVLASYISCTLILCYHHHAQDCIFGALIGALTACLGYRMAFSRLSSCRPRIGTRLKRQMREDRDVESEEDARDLESDILGRNMEMDRRDGPA